MLARSSVSPVRRLDDSVANEFFTERAFRKANLSNGFLISKFSRLPKLPGGAAGITSVILSHLNLQRLPVDAFNSWLRKLDYYEIIRPSLVFCRTERL